MTQGAPERRLIGWVDALVLAALTVLPQLLTGRGRLNADTKQHLYLDPVDLLDRARVIWDSRVGGGTVTHQAIGYLWPMGPYYALTDAVGLPDWAAQRLWVGGLQLAAALGALALFRHLLPRRWVQLPAAAVYGLSPFVLGLVTGQSGLLVPYAGLGWLVLVMAKAVESPRSWRWPAAFALVVTTCGSLNGSSVFFVVLAAVLWVPFALAGTGRAGLRSGLGVLMRAGVLTLATQLWWLVAYAVGGGYGLPVLDITETVRTTNATSSATEVLRGLGYWTFYGVDSGGPWLRGLADHYQTSVPLLVVTFAIPVLALLAGALVRWSHRAYFGALIGVGVVLSVGAFPVADPSPAGDLFEDLSRRIDLVLSLRNTQRAGALVALGLAALLAGGLTALAERPAHAGHEGWRDVVLSHGELPARRRARSGWRRLLGLSEPPVTPQTARRGRPAWYSARPGAMVGALCVMGLALAALPAQWRAGLVAERFDRPEDLPEAWEAAADHLDRGTGRVLEIPGVDFAAYRWGYALDPVTVGLTRRPVITRELVPTGGAAGVDLLEALDRSMQEGWFEVAALAPVARLLGASDVLVRNDLEYERYRTVRPRSLWPALNSNRNGLGEPKRFGGPYDNRAVDDLPMIDEIELALDPERTPPPQLAVFPVPGGGRPPISAQAPQGALVVDGDGEGVVAAAAAGLLDDERGPLLLGADVVAASRGVAQLGADTAFVLTDSNRKRAKRWYTLYENAGATEPAGTGVVLDDDADARLEIAGDEVPGARSVVEWRGVDRIWATAYGAPATLLPEDRPSNAFDGDSRTAWRSEREPDGATRAIGVDLGRPIDADHVTLVPSRRRGSVAVTSARVTLDGSRTFDVQLTEDQARDPAGARVELDGQPFTTLTVRVLGTSPHIGRGGFAEVAIPGVTVEELVRLPSALAGELGDRLADAPVAVVLTRLRADPADPLRADPEPAMARTLELPVPLGVAPSGTARIAPAASEGLIDVLLGAGPGRWPARATSSARLPGALDARASAAFDGDLSTAWQTPLADVAGQWLQLDLDQPVTSGSVTLEVRADDHHSLPTTIEVQVDDGPAVPLTLPAIRTGELGATRTVELDLPEAMTGRRWRITVRDAARRDTTDWYTGFPYALPVAIAEVTLPGVPVRPPAAPVDTGCRDDLLSVAGQPVPLRITGDAQDATGRAPLSVAPCAPIPLPAGPVDIQTTSGLETGLDVDRLVLSTGGWDDRAPPTGPASEAIVDDARPGDVTGRVRTGGDPFWLVLDESVNQGWELTIEDARADGPRPVDAYAAGWYVEPERAGTLDLTASFAPQRAVNVALLVSALAVLVCLLLLLVGGAAPHSAAAPARSATAARPVALWVRAGLGEVRPTQPPSWPAIALLAVAAGVLVQPGWALAGAAVGLAARRWPLAGRLAPAVLVAAGAALVVADQLRHRHAAAFAWPTETPLAHELAMLGAVTLLALSLDQRRRRAGTTPVGSRR